jgi:hypothetical protein
LQTYEFILLVMVKAGFNMNHTLIIIDQST